jgi:hypothetical protein
MSVLTWMIGAAVALSTTAGAVDTPPTAYDLTEDFSPPELVPTTWQALIGNWSAAGGTYNSTAPAQTALTVVDGLPMQSPYKVRARIHRLPGAANETVGIVYQMDDAQNYYEAVMEPAQGDLGLMRLRQVRNGEPQPPFSGARFIGTTTGIRDGWFDLEVVRLQFANVKLVEVRFNGILISRALDDAPSSGQVGLVTHDTVAQFDNVVVSHPFGDQPIRESFLNGIGAGWTPYSGTWTVARGNYRSTDVLQTTMTGAPIAHAGTGASDTVDYTLRTQMINPSHNAGNQVGLFFGRKAAKEYCEVVFSATSVATINCVSPTGVRNIATADYPVARNVWFDVKLIVKASLGTVEVSVNGKVLFPDTSIDAPNSPVFTGAVGLITHWTPARFDNVWFDHGYFVPFSERFDGPLPSSWVRSGTWNTDGARLNAVSAGANDLVTMACCPQTGFASGFAYRARLRNSYTGPGNLVGLVWSYQPAGTLGAGDHFEVLFAPTGEAYLNKVIHGEKYRVATASHSIGPNEGFTLAIRNTGFGTTIRLNDTTTLFGTNQDLGPGEIGVVTHFARGSFDTLSVSERLERPKPQP